MLTAHARGTFFWELHDNRTGEGGIVKVVRFSVLVELLVCGHAVGSPSAVIEMKGRDGYSTTPVLLWGTAAAGWYFYLEGGRKGRRLSPLLPPPSEFNNK